MVRRAAIARLMRHAPATCGIAIALGWAAQAHAACATWNPVATKDQYGARSITARDLIELVNFGRPDIDSAGGGPSPFGISPDGRWLATILQRGDVDTNGFCQALVLIDLRGRVAPRVLDRGGDFLMTVYNLRGHFMPAGVPRLDAARFSGAGTSIAYLKRQNGRTQVWVAPTSGGAARMASHAPSDVTRWTWSADRRSIIYGYETGAAEAEAAIADEGRRGWHYDIRTTPSQAMRPLIPAPLAEAVEAIDPESSALLTVSPADRALLATEGETPLGRPVAGASGYTASADHVSGNSYAPVRLVVRDAKGTEINCAVAACRGRISDLWWSDGGRVLVFMKAEGWNDRYKAIYRWVPGKDAPRRILQTDDLIDGCRLNGDALICSRQGSIQPQRLVAIDLRSGRQLVVFDPNPGFTSLRLGRVERLEWRNNVGREAYGDLVLPPDYAGGRLPVVVTMYRSRGFLRGGVGNDYPIQLFALRGFAVLSIDRPPLFADADPSIGNDTDYWRANTKDWADRRSVDSAIQTGLDLLIARGVADPARLGLTGLSDGASSVRFALLSSTRYAAAAISTCCVDETSDDMEGLGWERESRRFGYPAPAPVDPAFWRPYSLALNTATMKTPLLLQLSDHELYLGLHTYTALRGTGAPADMYYYPGEYHFKWQPGHRLAVYERNLDWFSFWLQGHTDPAPQKADQFARWRALAAARTAVPASSP